MTDFPSSTGSAWPPLKRAIWDVLMEEQLNDGHYIKAFDLVEKLFAAAEKAISVAQASHEGPARVEPVATVEHLPSTPSVDPAYAAKEPETTRNLRESLCDDCPPVGHYPDEGRCKLCPRRSTCIPSTHGEDGK